MDPNAFWSAVTQRHLECRGASRPDLEYVTLAAPHRARPPPHRRGAPPQPLPDRPPGPGARHGSLALAWTISHWSWFADDWIYLDQTQHQGFLEYVFQGYNSHLMPGQFLVTWIITQAGAPRPRVGSAGAHRLRRRLRGRLGRGIPGDLRGTGPAPLPLSLIALSPPLPDAVSCGGPPGSRCCRSSGHGDERAVPGAVPPARASPHATWWAHGQLRPRAVLLAEGPAHRDPPGLGRLGPARARRPRAVALARGPALRRGRGQPRLRRRSTSRPGARGR